MADIRVYRTQDMSIGGNTRIDIPDTAFALSQDPVRFIVEAAREELVKHVVNDPRIRELIRGKMVEAVEHILQSYSDQELAERLFGAHDGE